MLALGVVDEEHDDAGDDADGTTDIKQGADAMHDEHRGDAALRAMADSRADVENQAEDADDSGNNSRDEEGGRRHDVYLVEILATGATFSCRLRAK